jgi:hypothetical protein
MLAGIPPTKGTVWKLGKVWEAISKQIINKM